MPQYNHGDPLADSDSAILKRACAEVLHVHGDCMKRAEHVTEQKVKHKARKLCCEHVFKNAPSRGVHRPSIILPYKLPEVPPILSLPCYDALHALAQVAPWLQFPWHRITVCTCTIFFVFSALGTSAMVLSAPVTLPCYVCSCHNMLVLFCLPMPWCSCHSPLSPVLRAMALLWQLGSTLSGTFLPSCHCDCVPLQICHYICCA